jgi:8-oxo-dGTP pyrophosphatase MutT (NUDIX family)
MQRRIQTFYVGVKAFVVRDARLLLVRESLAPGWWELPGGRIDVGEEQLAPEDVLRRELTEELGATFRCTIVAPLFTWVRPPRSDGAPPTFLLGMDCRDPQGAIALSDEHLELRWVGRDEWQGLHLAPAYDRALARFWAANAGG